MSKYTIETRFICEDLADLPDTDIGHSVDEIINNSWHKIFDFNFPIFNEEYRSVLCKKILKHFYTREIGMETYGLWKLRLDTKMNEIMPYYNKMYESANLEYNPLHTVDYTREHSGSDNSSTTNNSSIVGSSQNHGTNQFSDTPQGGLVGLESGDYLTNASKNDSSGSSSSTQNGNSQYNSTDSYLEHVYGKYSSESYAKIIKEYRSALINVDMMVIQELGDLFMKVW